MSKKPRSGRKPSAHGPGRPALYEFALDATLAFRCNKAHVKALMLARNKQYRGMSLSAVNLIALEFFLKHAGVWPEGDEGPIPEGDG